MKIQDVQKQDVNRERKTISINLKVTKSVSDWLSENNVSPAKIFNISVEELMQTEEKNEAIEKVKRNIK